MVICRQVRILSLGMRSHFREETTRWKAAVCGHRGRQRIASGQYTFRSPTIHFSHRHNLVDSPLPISWWCASYLVALHERNRFLTASVVGGLSCAGILIVLRYRSRSPVKNRQYALPSEATNLNTYPITEKLHSLKERVQIAIATISSNHRIAPQRAKRCKANKQASVVSYFSLHKSH